MNKRSEQKWSYLYINSDYRHNLENLISKLNDTYNNYNKLPDSKKILISRKYYEIWRKTMKISSAFLHNNLIPAKEDIDIVRFLISADVFNNGEDVFLLYRGMCNLEKNNFIMPKKYYADKYINIFKEFGKFFKDRTELEKEYEMDF